MHDPILTFMSSLEKGTGKSIRLICLLKVLLHRSDVGDMSSCCVAIVVWVLRIGGVEHLLPVI